MIKPGLTLSTYLRLLVNKSAEPDSGCVLCLAPALEGRLCQECERDLPLLGAVCQTCGQPMPVSTPACGRCQKQRPAFDCMQVLFPYSFPISAMIGRFKYQGELAMVRPLATLLGEHLRLAPTSQPDLLLPCPLHPSRYRNRGFNQAAVIAAALGRALDIPVDYRLCVRAKATAPQTGLDRGERLRNLKGVFELKGSPPAEVAIVDDVITTGATAQQLAVTLKEGGAQRVSVWALARTPSN